MFREPISKIKNQKYVGPSSLMSILVKSAEESGISMITDLLNHFIVEKVIPA